MLPIASLASSQISSSMVKEPTLFDQVYGGARRRPAMISLNVQWVPVNDRSGAYQWNGSDANNRKEKTVTFFGTGEMRGKQRAKAITPPSSDYTDAYLSAIASKPIPTRHVNRISTAVFANAAPIPLKPTSPPLSSKQSIKTSETRFTNINNIQTSSPAEKLIPPSSSRSSPYSSSPAEKLIPPSSSRSSTYSSSATSDRSTPYEPLSTTQYSSPQSQTFTSSYSTLIRSSPSTLTTTPTPSVDSQRSYTTFTSRSQPRLSTLPSVSRYETSYNSIYKPLPAYSFQSYPPSNTHTTSLSSSSTESTFKPSAPLRSSSSLSTYNINQSSISEPTIRPTSTIEKQFDRPETLLFQHDEDMRPSKLEKPSPVLSSPMSSYATREELKIEPERLRMEQLSGYSSEPIRILENTIDKYDSLINQISEVLASVSPLSSTFSSMSPGKSVLDYQLSSDSSPVLPTKAIQPELSQQSMTVTMETSNTEQTKPAHLIRGDSYENVATFTSDINKNISLFSDIQIPTVTTTEETEEQRTLSSNEFPVQTLVEQETLKSTIEQQYESQSKLGTALENKEHETSFINKEEKKDIESLLSNEQELSPVIEEETEVTKSLTMKQTKPVTTDQSSYATVDEKSAETIAAMTGDQVETSTAEELKVEVQPDVTDEQQINLVAEEPKQEIHSSSDGQQQTHEITTTTVTTEEHQILSTSIKHKEDETKLSSADEQQVSSIPEKETKLESVIEARPVLISTEQNEDEVKIIANEEQQEDENKKTIIIAEEQVILSTPEDKEAAQITSPADEQHTSSIPETETKVERTVESQPVSISTEEKTDETKIIATEKQQVSLVAEEHEVDKTKTVVETQSVPIATEQNEDEAKIASIEEQVSPVIDTQKEEETKVESFVEPGLELVLTEQKEDEGKVVSTGEQLSSVTGAQKEEEETKTASVDNQQIPAATEEQQVEKTNTVTINEQQDILSTQADNDVTAIISSITATETKLESVVEPAPVLVSTEHNADDTKIVSTEEQQTLSVTETQKDEETKTASADEQQVPPAIEEQEAEKTKAVAIDEQKTAVIIETEVEPVLELQPVPISTEPNEDEAKIVSIEEQVSPATDVQKEEETKVESVLELQSEPISPEQKGDEAKIVSIEEQVSPITDVQKEEETRVEPEPVSTEQKGVETKIVSTEEQLSSVTGTQKEEETKAETRVEPEPVSTEQKDDEAKIVFTEGQVSPVIDAQKEEETKVESFVEPELVLVPTEQKEGEGKVASTGEQLSSVTGTQKEEETKVESVLEFQPEPISTEQNEDQTKIVSTEEQISPVTDVQKEEETKAETRVEPEPVSTEQKDDEAKIVSTEGQVSPVIDTQKEDETKVEPVLELQAVAISAERNEDEAKIISIEEQQASPLVDSQKKEEDTKMASVNEQQVSQVTEEQEADKTKIVDIDEQQDVSAIPEEEQAKSVASSIDEQHAVFTTETEKGEETKMLFTDEQETISASGEDTQELKTLIEYAEELSSLVVKEVNTLNVVSIEEHQVSSTLTDEKQNEENALSTIQQETPLLRAEEEIEEKEEVESKTLSNEVQQVQSVNEDEKREEATNASVDEHSTIALAEEKIAEEFQIASSTEIENVQASSAPSEEQQTQVVTDDETKVSIANTEREPLVSEEQSLMSITPAVDTSATDLLPFSESKSDEEKIIDKHIDVVQQQTDLPVKETSPSVSVTESSKNTRKHVTWDETVVDNEDGESSSSESVTDESSTSETSIAVTPVENGTAETIDSKGITASESNINVDQQVTSSDVAEPQLTSDETISLSKPLELSSTLSSADNQSLAVVDSTDLQVVSTEQLVHASYCPNDQENLQATVPNEQKIIPSDSIDREARSCSPGEASSIVSDSTSQEITLSDVTESQLSLNEQHVHTIANSTDEQSISTTDSSKEDTFTVDEISTTNSDITTNEDIGKLAEEVAIDLHNVETSAPLVEIIPQKPETSIIDSTTLSLQPTIVSAIDTLADTVTSRYISSDVYHGYLGEHKKFLQDTSVIDNNSTAESLIASLRETLITPTTPLIETIQDVVSSMQTTTYSYKIESEITQPSQDDANLATAVADELPEDYTYDGTLVEKNQFTIDNSEQLKAAFESLRQTAIAPIAAITETIQASMSSNRSDNQEISSSPNTAQLATTNLEGKGSIVEIESSSGEQTNDNANKDISFVAIDNIHENVSQTITETSQNVVTTITLSTDTHTEGETIVQQEKPEGQSIEDSTAVYSLTEETKAGDRELSNHFLADSIVPTSLDTTGIIAESLNEQKENQQTVLIESSSLEILESTSVVQKSEGTTAETIEFTPVNQNEEPLAMSSPVAVEQADASNKQETTSVDHSTDEKTSAYALSTMRTDHAEQISVSTSTPSEQLDVTVAPEISEAKTSNEITTEHSSGSNESIETKTTFETFHDVITHPFETITGKIQSVISTSIDEQTSVNAEKSSVGKSEEVEVSKEHQIAETENLAIDEQTVESSETKSTFENISDFVRHPRTTITEEIQSVLTSSTTEEVPSLEQQTSIITTDQKKDEDILSTAMESNFETSLDTITKSSTITNETVQDIVLNSTEQTSSPEEKEQISTIQQTRSYVQDQVQGEYEARPTTVSSQIFEDEKQESQNERTVDDNIENIVSQHEISADANNHLPNAIHSLISDIISKVLQRLSESSHDIGQIVEENSSSGSGLTSPITVINGEDRSESSQSTLSQQTIKNEDDTFDNKISSSEITWENLLDEKSSDETIDQSFEEMKRLLEDVVQSSNDITVEIIENKTTITLPNHIQSAPIIESESQQTIIKPQIDYIMVQSSVPMGSDSASEITEIENVSSKLSSNFHDSSPTNTEDDSLELIHALQGHSIIHPSSTFIEVQPSTTNQSSLSTSHIEKIDVQSASKPERSASSTTTSSQITSSDRYVSYAIHEMGDSSQERLPSFPLVADMPVYEPGKTTSDGAKDEQIQSELNANINRIITKDDDLTEFDATENLTYSDDVLLQKLHASAPNREKNLDASSTDDDVDDANFNELENNDVSNLHRVMDEMNQHHESVSQGLEQIYQRYDISNSSSTSTKPTTDDVYIIPGYSGLWRSSVNDTRESSSANDADDEDDRKQSTTTVKTRTIVRTSDPNKLQSLLQTHQEITSHDTPPVRTDTYDVFNRPLNEFSFDMSESDSFKTCASTITSSVTSKQFKQSDLFNTPISEQDEQQRLSSPDEKIILIRECERGISLPATMKIQFDDMALRLSASTPIDAALYSTTQTDLPSPSTLSEPMQKTISSCHTSTTSLSSNESEKQKLPSQSWLNTTNTITATNEGPDGRK
ncbi:unnamed protein product [Rotaria socialis]